MDRYNSAGISKKGKEEILKIPLNILFMFFKGLGAVDLLIVVMQVVETVGFSGVKGGSEGGK